MWTDRWTGQSISTALDTAAERYGVAVAQVFEMGVDFCMKGVALRLRGPSVITVRAP